MNGKSPNKNKIFILSFFSNNHTKRPAFYAGLFG